MSESQSQTNNTQQENQAKSKKRHFFQVESGVEPPKYKRRCKWSKFVYRMKPGDSMLVKTKSQALQLAQSIRGAGYKTRSENKNIGVRVWMMEALKGE